MDDARATGDDAAQAARGVNDGRRRLGIAFGLVTQVGFLVTVWYLFGFLRFGSSPGKAAWLLVDTVLTLQFAMVHSVLLHPYTKKRLSRYVASEFYGLVFLRRDVRRLGGDFCFLAW